jgi:septal ring factor EnvC (AmiA/AmiB activator)
MHQKLILALVLIAVGCFLTVKYSIWFIIIPIILFALIFAITKAKDLLKIVVPAVAIMIVGAFAFGNFSGPSAEELKAKLSVHETDLVKMKKDLNERQQELKKAKDEQGLLKSIFKDSEKVNILEGQVNVLQGEIAKLEKDIYDLKKNLRKVE